MRRDDGDMERMKGYIAMSSWPKRGGNDTIVSNIIGTSHENGYSATSSAYGAKNVIIYHKSESHIPNTLPKTKRRYPIMKRKSHNSHNQENDSNA